MRQRLRTTSGCSLIFCLLSITGLARAQGARGALRWGEPVAQGPMEQPIGQLTLPVEVAALSSRVGLQFAFTRIEGEQSGLNGVSLALQAQYAAADLFEVGIDLPILLHGWAGGVQLVGDSTELGNLQLNLKAKLVGDSRGPFALAIYANTTLPTTTADLRTREFAAVQAGLAGTLHWSLVTAGLATGPWVLIFGEGSEDAVLYTLDWFVALRLHPMVALQLGMQLGFPVQPDGDDTAFVFNPALTLYPLPAFHLDIGARIAATDEGRVYTGGGRAAFLMAMAYDF